MKEIGLTSKELQWVSGHSNWSMYKLMKIVKYSNKFSVQNPWISKSEREVEGNNLNCFQMRYTFELGNRMFRINVPNHRTISVLVVRLSRLLTCKFKLPRSVEEPESFSPWDRDSVTDLKSMWLAKPWINLLDQERMKDLGFSHTRWSFPMHVPDFIPWL